VMIGKAMRGVSSLKVIQSSMREGAGGSDSFPDANSSR